MAAQVAVLLVDDDPIQCESLKDVLESYSCDVTPCTDPRQALRLASRRHYDLVLIDLKLPGMSGLELVRRIKPHGHGCLVLMTGMSAADVAETAILAGADGVLEKPIALDSLLIWRDESLRVRDGGPEDGDRVRGPDAIELPVGGFRHWQLVSAF
jgi:CheY-like chemotaxis protein